MTYLILAAVTFVLTIIFVMAEAALATFSWVKYEKRVNEKKKKPERWMAYLDRVDFIRLTAGTVASFFQILLVLSIVIYLAQHYGSYLTATFFVSFGVAVVFVLVLGNILPRLVAEKNAERLLVAFMPFLSGVAFLFRPFGAAILFTRALLGRMTGSKEKTPEEEAEEDLRSAIEEGEHEGAIEEKEREMIEAVLYLGDVDVSRIMTPRTDMVAIPIDKSIREIISEVCNAGHSRIPVYEGNRDTIRGILYVKDLVRYLDNQNGDIPSLDDIIRDAFVVPETKPVQELLQEFKARKVHIAVVLDEYGGTAGIVTMEDILEEIVGEIEDEFDEPPKELFKKLAEKTVEADARMTIHDVNEVFDIELPEDEDFDTIGGFVATQLGKIPVKGEKFSYNGAEFTVTDANERRVKTILIKLLTTEEPPAS
ncbi:MAG: HlyC/CorC family transporter [Planctomycetota bacterium]|nr:MAG: HlyC/CorC family transporter [Planctomycetota bacterium]